MRSVVIGGAVLGLAVVLGSQLSPVGEAVGTVALRSDDPSSATASVYAHAPRAIREATRSADPAVLPEDLTVVVGKYCVVCHNDQLLTGNLTLQGFDVGEAVADAEVAEKMIRKLRLGMMPPPGMPRPGGDTLRALVETLEDMIDRAATSTPNSPGTRRFQRLNQGEYERVIRDLLGLDVDAERWLPGDRFVSSYDTWSDVQIQAAATLEAYLSAAEDLSRMAIGVGDQLPPSIPVSYLVPGEVSQHAWDRVEGAPYGTRGGTVVLHHFPVAAEYVFSVKTGFGQG